MPRRAVVLVDGEHHPPALRTALDELDVEVTLALFVGGGEKLDVPGEAPDIGYPARWPGDPEAVLHAVLDELAADVVLDLSGEPVVSARRRLRLAAIALAAGVAYEAPGVRYEPPAAEARSVRPTVAVLATGKRTGKTAVAGELARFAARQGRTPVIVAMGRGGPAEPTVVPAGAPLGVDALLEVVAAGGHAASDFYEDAVTSGAATVGCRRVGDGPTGMPGWSNVAAGVALADEQPGDLTLLEGSGAAIPPAHADAHLLVVPATATEASLAAGLPLRFLLADTVLVTLADAVDEAQRARVLRAVRGIVDRFPPRDRPPVPVVLTALQPHPLGEVAGRRVVFTTTAPPDARGRLVACLQDVWGAEVVAVSHHLADRPALVHDLATAPPYDVLLTELKAAAIDVAAVAARERGAQVVLCDNRPVALDPPVGSMGVSADLEGIFAALLERADARHAS